jgi:hypothetical protein
LPKDWSLGRKEKISKKDSGLQGKRKEAAPEQEETQSFRNKKII